MDFKWEKEEEEDRGAESGTVPRNRGKDEIVGKGGKRREGGGEGETEEEMKKKKKKKKSWPT